MLQFKVLACLLTGPRSKFECNICCWISLDSNLAEANRHVNAEHGLNLVQYYKMASGKVGKGNMWKIFNSVTINFTRLHSHQPSLHDSSIDDWSEACLYKCHICWSFTTTSRGLFCKHLGDAHAGVSESDYIVRMRCNFRCLCTVSSKTWPFQNEYSSLTFLESYIECKRCGTPVLHNKDSIEKHQEVIVSN